MTDAEEDDVSADIPLGVTRGVASLRGAIEANPHLTWKEDPKVSGRVRSAWAVLQRDETTGGIWVLAVIENGTAPLHRHKPGGLYGELVMTLAGELVDATDDGRSVLLRPGDVLWHGSNTKHQPSARFWLGVYHQPRGMELLGK